MHRGEEVHTVPDARREGWWVNEYRGKVVGRRHRTKEVAVAAGRAIAQKVFAEHVIHRKDGVIKEKNSYGNDPFPPRDGR